jgi:3-(3-hydroxy-phenyl)propionate hydroxylase
MCGNELALLCFNTGVKHDELKVIAIDVDHVAPEVRARYLGMEPSAVYLIRPDQHVAARWTAPSAHDIEDAAALTLGKA